MRPFRRAMRKFRLEASAGTADDPRVPGPNATALSDESSILLMAWMYLGGGTFGVGVILVSQLKHLLDSRTIALVVTAYAVGVLLLFGRRWLPRTAIDSRSRSAS